MTVIDDALNAAAASFRKIVAKNNPTITVQSDTLTIQANGQIATIKLTGISTVKRTNVKGLK